MAVARIAQAVTQLCRPEPRGAALSDTRGDRQTQGQSGAVDQRGGSRQSPTVPPRPVPEVPVQQRCKGEELSRRDESNDEHPRPRVAERWMLVPRTRASPQGQRGAIADTPMGSLLSVPLAAPSGEPLMLRRGVRLWSPGCTAKPLRRPLVPSRVRRVMLCGEQPVASAVGRRSDRQRIRFTPEPVAHELARSRHDEHGQVESRVSWASWRGISVGGLAGADAPAPDRVEPASVAIARAASHPVATRIPMRWTPRATRRPWRGTHRP